MQSLASNVSERQDLLSQIFIMYNEGKKEMFYLTTLNTFYLQLYGVGHMVKYHSNSERKPAAATWATLSD